MSERGKQDSPDPLVHLSDITGVMGEVVRQMEGEDWFTERDRRNLRVVLDAMMERVEGL